MTVYRIVITLFRFSGVIVIMGNNIFALTAAIFLSGGFLNKRPKKI